MLFIISFYSAIWDCKIIRIGFVRHQERKTGEENPSLFELKEKIKGWDTFHPGTETSLLSGYIHRVFHF